MFPIQIQLDWGSMKSDGRFVLKIHSDVPISQDVFGDVATFKKANSNGRIFSNVILVHLFD